MALGIYKPGQGRWSRGVGAAGLAAMGIWAAIETYGWMLDYTTAGYFYVGYAVPALLLLGALTAAWFVANRPPATDFIIETETEMKKVTWPTAKEVVNSTVVVIIVMVLMGAFMFIVDRLAIEPLFKYVFKILPKG